MSRRAFFSFHYERDIWRVNVVRNSWVTRDREVAGFWDASLWEEAKKKGDTAVKRMINDGLIGTSVTVVLIGAETHTRKYVLYEIEKSIERGNGILGIYIHNIKDQNSRTDTPGISPLSYEYKNYDWVSNDGYNNIGDWIEDAAADAGR